MNKMTKTERIAAFLVQNWHYCPLDEELNIPNCAGWRNKACVKCICQNSEALILADWQETEG